MVSKSDFDNWKLDPVTKAYFDAINSRIDEAKEILSYSAGSDSLYDKHLVGMLQAFREMLEIKVTEDTEDES
jgi:hypothetical protein